jgi:hypothetical protein
MACSAGFSAYCSLHCKLQTYVNFFAARAAWESCKKRLGDNRTINVPDVVTAQDILPQLSTTCAATRSSKVTCYKGHGLRRSGRPTRNERKQD